MRQLILTALVSLAAVASSASCGGGKQTLRDLSVYETELQFADNVVMQQHDQLHTFIVEYCTCPVTPECEAAIETWTVVESRWQWHTDMMRYNGKLTDVDPGQAPDFVDFSGVHCE